MNITRSILEKLSDKYSIEYVSSYGEPGYSTSKQAILFSNWNNVPKYVQKKLEQDYELQWSDEWYLDYNSDQAYRTSPDSYCWTPSVIFTENGALTVDQAKDDPESYLESLVNDPTTCDIFGILKPNSCNKLGYKLIQDDLESGWYHQSTDDPHKILKELLDHNPKGEYIFGNIRNEQFRTNFAIFEKLAE
jgi:hypothetical protein